MTGIQPDESIFLKPEFNEKESAWKEHIPFSFWISKMLRPHTFVELGAHYGTSYFSFCQAFKQYSIRCRSYAVDHWEGDQQAGFYDINVYRYVSEMNQKHFEDISTLLKMSFDDAKDKFDDEEIDLLHIDGMHSYDAVKHDFYNWLPKMSKKGVVLLHDTQVKKEGFGVWKLLDELKDQFPTVEFGHGYGLGVVGVGEKVDRELFKCIGTDKKSYVHRLFAATGKKTFLEYQANQLEELVQAQGHSMAQLFYLTSSKNFSEEESILISVKGTQRHISFKFNEPLDLKRLRFDPLNDYTKIKLHSVQLFRGDVKIEKKLSITSNASRVKNHEYLFSTSDPNIYFDFPGKKSVTIDRVDIELEYLQIGKAIIPELLDYLHNT